MVARIGGEGGGLDRRRHGHERRAPTTPRCSAAGAGLTAVERLDAGRRGQRVLRGPPARPPRHADAVDGVLPLQQRRRHRGRAGRTRRAGAGRRLRRPPRQRHPGHLLERRARRLRLVPPVPAVPGVGGLREVGAARAGASTINLPLPAGATGDAFRAGVDDVLAPFAAAFDPTWLLISAGFDAHRADPITDLGLSAGDYADLTTALLELAPPGPADRVPRGRLRPRGAGRRRRRRAWPPCSASASSRSPPPAGARAGRPSPPPPWSGRSSPTSAEVRGTGCRCRPDDPVGRAPDVPGRGPGLGPAPEARHGSPRARRRAAASGPVRGPGPRRRRGAGRRRARQRPPGRARLHRRGQLRVQHRGPRSLPGRRSTASAGSLAMAVRRVPPEIPELDELGLPAAGRALRRGGEGAGPRHRSARLGQDDHGGRAHRPDQPPAAPATSSPSRTRSRCSTPTPRPS